MNIEEKYEKLALEALNHSKNILLVNLRFLGYAFDQLKLVCKGKSIAVDGRNIYFNPLWVLGKYKEERETVARDCLLKEFVIVIDTSGSVSGSLVQMFLQKTYNILKQEESFVKKINLHIIQCDAEVPQDVKITRQAEFDEYIKTMQLHGFGGTDFRPAFSYVDKLIKNKEFSNLKGLIYFTDGYGTFPSHPREYNTAFVFVEDTYEIPEVPVWAIKLVLSPNEIK